MDFYILPAALSIPFIIVLFLSLFVPSKGSKMKRVERYYSSSLVNIIYGIAGTMLLCAAVFAVLYVLDSGMFLVEFSFLNIALYTGTGTTLALQNFLAVRRSKKAALSGVSFGKAVSFRTEDDEAFEVAPMEVEAFE